MQNAILKDVYQLLRQINVVDSESEFSRDWLGRSDCYLRSCRFKNTEPSVSTLAICASKLQHYGNRMMHSDKNRMIAERFLDLSAACHQQINRQCAELWLTD
jgi:hypothetical protein